MARVEIEHTVQGVVGGQFIPVSNAEVTIRKRSDNTLVTWYEAETGGTGSTSAIQTDDFGRINAWVDPGRYNLVVEIPGEDPITHPTNAVDTAVSAERKTATVTTPSLGVNVAHEGTIELAKSFRLIKMVTNRPCRVRLYTTPAARAGDAARPVGTDPGQNTGNTFEAITVSGFLTLDLTPQVDGSNLEATSTSAIPYSIQNRDTVAGTVTVTFTYFATEE